MTNGDNIGRGIVFAAATFACFSTADAAVKYLTGGYSVFQVASLTALFSFIPITILVARTGGIRTIKPRNVKGVALRAVLLMLDTLFAYFAFSRLPMANVYTLIFGAPLLVTALSPWLLKDSVGWHRWAAVVVGFIGIVIILRPGLAPMDVGYFSALGAAFVFGMAMIVTRRIGATESNGAMLVWVMGAKCVIPGVLMLLSFSFAPMSITDLALMAFAGIFVGMAHIFMVMAFRHAPAPIAAPFMYTQMLWAVFYGYIFFGDVPDGFVIAGSALVVASGLYILWRENSQG
ncbi:MAG: DMT family transporter [Rhodospirillales bacterium]|nr:DMT family transporter [Rhodospirillales bacterium]